MLKFLSTYWLWILLIGGMLFMHLGHGGHGGHHGAQKSGTGKKGTPESAGEPPAATVATADKAHQHHSPDA